MLCQQLVTVIITYKSSIHKSLKVWEAEMDRGFPVCQQMHKKYGVKKFKNQCFCKKPWKTFAYFSFFWRGEGYGVSLSWELVISDPLDTTASISDTNTTQGITQRNLCQALRCEVYLKCSLKCYCAKKALILSRCSVNVSGLKGIRDEPSYCGNVCCGKTD